MLTEKHPKAWEPGMKNAEMFGKFSRKIAKKTQKNEKRKRKGGEGREGHAPPSPIARLLIFCAQVRFGFAVREKEPNQKTFFARVELRPPPSPQKALRKSALRKKALGRQS